MGYLISRLGEHERVEELRAIERLGKENQLLRDHIKSYEKIWYGTVDLLGEIDKAVALVRKAVEENNRKREAAEKDWLGFWGIYRGTLNRI
jgi:hypothetical protein